MLCFCFSCLRLLYPMLSVSLDCPFWLPLQYSLTFILKTEMKRKPTVITIEIISYSLNAVHYLFHNWHLVDSRYRLGCNSKWRTVCNCQYLYTEINSFILLWNIICIRELQLNIYFSITKSEALYTFQAPWYDQ